jgi:hypothetical protein
MTAVSVETQREVGWVLRADLFSGRGFSSRRAASYADFV